MNVTSKTTRAELVEMLSAAVITHEEMKREVVEVAMTAARAHGLCTVVEKTLRKVNGLADVLPPTFVVQRQYRAGSKWVDQTGEIRGEKSAISDYNSQVRQKALPPRSNADHYMSTSRVTTYNVDTLMQELKKAKESFTPKSAYVVPVYPKWRLVKRHGGTDEVIRGE